MNNFVTDFPLLKKTTYLDSACMSLKPRQVLAAVMQYYEEYPACAGRSQHRLGQIVEEKTELTRKTTATFFHAKPEEIVFTKNTTEGINLLAHSLHLQKKDVVLTTDKEHNSNLLPWQRCTIDTVSTDSGFDFSAFEKKVKHAHIVAMGHTSNLDGTSVPAKEIIKEAHKHGALVVLDAAQSAPHQLIDVKKLDVDFLACSGHKMLGPTGVGVLYGKKELLAKLNPFMTGGGTAIDSWQDRADYELPPKRFEAGLQNYAGIIGFGAALDYIRNVGMEHIAKHETQLNSMLTEQLQHPKLTVLGPKEPEKRAGIFSFTVKGMDPHTVALLLNEHNICVRSGAHCVHSWFNAHNVQGSVRASFYFYNSKEDVEKLVSAMKTILKAA